MTYQDPNSRDPRVNPTDDPLNRAGAPYPVEPARSRGWTSWGWGIGIIAVLIVVVVMIASNRDTGKVAGPSNPPATTTGMAPAPAPAGPSATTPAPAPTAPAPSSTGR